MATAVPAGCEGLAAEVTSVGRVADIVRRLAEHVEVAEGVVESNCQVGLGLHQVEVQQVKAVWHWALAELGLVA